MIWIESSECAYKTASGFLNLISIKSEFKQKAEGLLKTVSRISVLEARLADFLQIPTESLESMCIRLETCICHGTLVHYLDFQSR